MRISFFRLGQWILISMAVGALAGIGRYYLPIYQDAEMRPGITPSLFVLELRYGGGDAVHELTIYPTLDGKNYVRGVFRGPGSPDKPFQFNADNPFKFGPAPAGQDIRAFLRKNYPKVPYRYAWWVSNTAQGLIWGSGTALVFGILFLGAVRKFIAGEGMGILDLLKGIRSSPAAATTSKKPAPQDYAQVDAFNSELDETLQNSVGESAGNSPTETAVGPVRALSNIVEEQPLPAEEQKPKDYRGEFYPVSRGREDKQK